MSDLLEAAKAVIDRWDRPLWKVIPATSECIETLRAAVERAESAQHAERERIKEIITYQFGDLVSDLDEVFEMIDDDSEAQGLDPTRPAGKQK